MQNPNKLNRLSPKYPCINHSSREATAFCVETNSLYCQGCVESQKWSNLVSLE